MFKKLLGNFIELPPDNEPESPKPSTKATPSPVQATQVAVALPVTLPNGTHISGTVSTIPGQIDPDIAAILNDAITKSNLEGFDYLEFRSSIEQLGTTQLLEDQKYNAVFITVKNLGVTKKHLVDSVGHYINVVESKKAEFNQFIDDTFNTEIKNGEQKIKELNDEILKKSQEIEKLTKSIQETRTQQETILADINKNKIVVQQKMAVFETTSNDILSRLTQDRQKLEAYLKE